jgi:hypothetical protein
VAPDMKKRRMGSNRIKRLITVRPDTRKNLRKKICPLKTLKKEFVEKTTIIVAVGICLTPPPPLHPLFS